MSYRPTHFIKISIINLLLVSAGIGYAQENEVTIQTWYSFSLNKNFSTNFMFYTNPEYYDMVKGDDKWGEVALTTGVEYYPSNKFDLYSDIYTSSTQQATGVNTLEIRPRIGVRWHISTPEHKIPISIRGLYEFRNQYDTEASIWANAHRFRLRSDFRFSLNRSNILQDKNILLRLYGELFMNTNKDIEERFWNSRQLGTGVYYRHNGKRRYELRYVLQGSKNNLEDVQYKVSSHVLYLLVTFFL